MAKWLQEEKAPKQEPSRERVSGGREGGGKKSLHFLLTSNTSNIPGNPPPKKTRLPLHKICLICCTALP